MAYQSTIIRASQDYSGLAWMQYDSAFHRQAALTGLTRWSATNPTIYTLCFAGCAKTATRCELCFATIHSSKECAQQGDPDPGVRERLQASETAVLSMTPRFNPPIQAGSQPREPSGEICRLWKANRCTFQHTHTCSGCGGPYPILSCPRRGPQHSTAPYSGKRPPGPARPY